MLTDKGRDGFTLLETLIAFLILSGVLAVSAQTVALATKSLTMSSERKEALELADELQVKVLPDIWQQRGEATGSSRTQRWKITKASMASETGTSAAFAILTIVTSSGRESKFIYFQPDRRSAQ